MEENKNNSEYQEQAQILLPTPKKHVPKWASVVVLIVLALICILLGYVLKIQDIIVPPTTENIVTAPSPYDDLVLEAKAAVVWDIANQKVLFAKNENAALPLASLTKVMAALVAADLIPGYTTVTIDKKFLEEDGDTGLFANERWNFKDLSRFSLAVSSNDGMRAIASVAGAVLADTSGSEEFETGRSAFVSRMNEKAKKVGLTSMSFENETGLDLTIEKGGAHGSAKDMARLFEYALANYPDVLESTRETSFSVSSLSNFKHNATNTNPYVNVIPGIVASKTGFTDISGGNLVVAFNPELGRPIVISVLSSSYDGRFFDTLKLVDSTMQLLERENSF